MQQHAEHFVSARLSGEWESFRSNGVHLTFAQHVGERLERAKCSHRGAAVYKWEGRITDGPHLGETGILIGETNDLRRRIKQYVSGTQKRGQQPLRVRPAGARLSRHRQLIAPVRFVGISIPVGRGAERWTLKFGQLAKVESRPRKRSLACHGRDGVIPLS